MRETFPRVLRIVARQRLGRFVAAHQEAARRHRDERHAERILDAGGRFGGAGGREGRQAQNGKGKARAHGIPKGRKGCSIVGPLAASRQFWGTRMRARRR
ncbi:hypothetical protein MyNCGM683_39100 [Achromobacter xylosoxidans]